MFTEESPGVFSVASRGRGTDAGDQPARGGDSGGGGTADCVRRGLQRFVPRKIRIYHQRGQGLPEGWALDREGRPTTDPEAAIDGLLMPIGGFKGTGLAMVMGLLSSMLSGASYGTELGSMEGGPRPGADGHFVAAIRVGAFEDAGRFKRRVDGAVRQIHNCGKAAGVDRIYAPGEKEFLNREACLREDIPLNAVTLADLERTAGEMEVEVAQYGWLKTNER